MSSVDRLLEKCCSVLCWRRRCWHDISGHKLHGYTVQQ